MSRYVELVVYSDCTNTSKYCCNCKIRTNNAVFLVLQLLTERKNTVHPMYGGLPNIRKNT